MNQAPASNSYSQRSVYCIIYFFSLLAYTLFHEESVFIDCDSPWHIAAGDYIRAMGSIPLHDPWSFTTGDTRWYNLSWLYDVIISWLKDMFGLQGLVAINVIMAATIPCLLARLCFLKNCSNLATLCFCLIATAMLSASLSVRPQLMAIIPIALALIVLYQDRISPSKLIWTLPLISIFWTNIHGSYLVMYTILGSFGLELIWHKNWKRLKTYILVGIACLLASIVNPLGYEVYLGSMLTITGHSSQTYVTEWAAATLSDQPEIFFYLAMLILLPLIARVKLDIADGILAAFWMVMALSSIRYNVVATIFITPVLAYAATHIFRKIAVLNSANETFTTDFSDPKISKFLGVMVAISMLLYCVPMVQKMLISDKLYNPDKYPVNEIAFLQENHPNSRIFNEYCYGGYIIYQTGGLIQPFLDSRIDSLYPEQVKKDYFAMAQFLPDWNEIANQYQVEYALFPNELEGANKAFLEANWPILHKGEIATIYENPSKFPPTNKEGRH